jgi:CheY-like chemotaxis protein
MDNGTGPREYRNPDREFATLNVADLRGLSVLLVEDELHVLLLIEDFLKELGCTVHAVSTYDEALRAADSAAVDAAVLDVNLHGRRSFPVADVLARRNIPIVFSTGYGSQGLDVAWKDRPWLQKPFMAEQLAHALRTALDAGARPSAAP